MITRPESPVYLGAIDEGDLEPVHRWHNDPALCGSLVGTFAATSLATERAFACISSPDVHPQPSRPPRR
jgi:hypothetical protein